MNLLTTRRGPAVAICLAACACALAMRRGAQPADRSADGLPSWNDGPSRKAILGFVARAVAPGGEGWIAPEDRIAVFDNDGTLWCEQPVYVQMAFAMDRLKALAPQHPEWKTQEPFASLLAGNLKAAAASGERAVAEALMVTHAGMTTDEFARIVTDWIGTARHPKTGRLYADMVYQPMLELLAYLRANGFRTYIVSGGGVEFMRAWVQRAYGVPPEQVIGSTIRTKYDMRPDGPVLMRLAEIDFVDDHAGKPAGINTFIGRRPVFAFGNSDGDQQMLQWTAGGSGPRFVGLVHHTDGAREWAYDRGSHVGALDQALDEAVTRGWTVVSMKDDWNAIYPK